MARRLLAAVALTGLLTMACGAPPDAVAVVSRNPLGRAVPVVDATIRDPAAVRALYADVLALPPAPRGPVACPSDTGVRYRLTFMRRAAVILRADADPSGCRQVRLGDGRVLWALGPRGDALWAVLAGQLGVAPDTLAGR
jgi:hypothetical protein